MRDQLAREHAKRLQAVLLSIGDLAGWLAIVAYLLWIVARATTGQGGMI